MLSLTEACQGPVKNKMCKAVESEVSSTVTLMLEQEQLPNSRSSLQGRLQAPGWSGILIRHD